VPRLPDLPPLPGLPQVGPPDVKQSEALLDYLLGA
jgi:hypothetical protein